MPGDPRRRPCLVSPYHYRLDWQMWFVGNDAARGEAIEDEPWLVHLVWQLLEGEDGPRRLLARDPFPGAPPRWIRAGLWRYRFSESRADGAWWRRERVGEYLRPLSTDDAGLREFVDAYGWPDAPHAERRAAEVGRADRASEGAAERRRTATEGRGSSFRRRSAIGRLGRRSLRAGGWYRYPTIATGRTTVAEAFDDVRVRSSRRWC